MSEDLVPVWIFGDEYECPEHYQWSEGLLADSYDSYKFLIPREQLERWREVQEAFLEMNQEMKAFKELRAKKVSTRYSAGLPW